MLVKIITILLTFCLTTMSFCMEGQKEKEETSSPKQSPKPFKKTNSAPQAIEEEKQARHHRNLRDSMKKAHSAQALLVRENIDYYDSPCGSGRRRAATDVETYTPAPEKPDLSDLPPSSKN